MGLERHVDDVLFDAPDVFEEYYEWSYGLLVKGTSEIIKEIRAEKIIRALNKSGEFGRAYYSKEDSKIHFEPYHGNL